MGSPALSFFCKNGHLVLDLPPHVVCNSFPTRCQHCGSREIRSELDWYDDTCNSKKVPHTPINFDLIESKKESIPVFDVSILFGKVKK